MGRGRQFGGRGANSMGAFMIQVMKAMQGRGRGGYRGGRGRGGFRGRGGGGGGQGGGDATGAGAGDGNSNQPSSN